MSRIQLMDTDTDVMVKMSGGNPGAMSALVELLVEGEATDPDNFMGSLGTILLLDTLEIYGTDIYVLYSDICQRKVNLMVAILRAYQLGYLDGATLKDASHRQDRSGASLIDVEGLYTLVREHLPNFDPNTPRSTK